MKLNPDCTRAILMAIEEVCDATHYFSSKEDLKMIAGNFSQEEIDYHARQCGFAGLIVDFKCDVLNGWTTKDLSPKGHEFLANIRTDTIWNKVKSISVEVGSKSISGLMQIASAVVTELIKDKFGLR